MSDDVV